MRVSACGRLFQHGGEKLGQLQRDDKKISVALMSIFVILTLQYFILVIFNLIGTPSEARVQLLSKLLAALVFVYAFPIIWKRSKVRLLGTYFIWLFIFLFHYLIFPDNRIYMNEHVFTLFFMCLPAFVYAWSVNDWTVLWHVMRSASVLVFFIGAALAVLVCSGRSSLGSYSMSLSYYMLLPAVIFTDACFERLSLKNVFYALISVLIILALGSRGAMLCLGVFIILRLKPQKRVGYKEIFAYLVIMIAGFLVIIFLDDLLEYLYGVLIKFGIKSRSIALFLRPELHWSGRDKLYEIVMEEVLKRPLLGLGLAGDRPLIRGAYVHNFFIEFVAHFGVFMGLLMSILLVLLMIKRLITDDTIKYKMTVIWISIGFVPFQVSSSYLININFWIFLGLLFGATSLRDGELM